MPHRVQMQVIRRRLVGKDGTERIRELRQILRELPGYKTGPYADIRKWVNTEIERSRVRSKVVHRDSIAVPRQGAAQIALVGPPNAGKSSLLVALSGIQLQTADYAFTTKRPVPALTRLGGVLVQLVEIPGLIRDAAEGRGNGRALLGVLREADAIAWCHDVRLELAALDEVRHEVAAAGIDKPSIIIATKTDEAPDKPLDQIANATNGPRVVPVSVLDDGSLEALREALWELTGLVRVYTRRDDEVASDPLALPAGSTVLDVAACLHRDMAEGFVAARVWGPSARFDGQRFGADHPVADGDVIEILTRG